MIFMISFHDTITQVYILTRTRTNLLRIKKSELRDIFSTNVYSFFKYVNLYTFFVLDNFFPAMFKSDSSAMYQIAHRRDIAIGE